MEGGMDGGWTDEWISRGMNSGWILDDLMDE
jgi:hypothetical protein